MNNSKIIAYGIVKATIILALIALGLFFVYEIQSVIYYIIISLILCLIANPIVEFLKRKLKFPNALAVSVTLFFFVALMIGVALLFVPLINSQGDKLSLLDAKNIQLKMEELYIQLNSFLNNYNLNLDRFFNKSGGSKINVGFFTDFFSSVLNTIGNFGAGFASVIFISFFLLKDKIGFIAVFKRIMPSNHQEQIINTITKTNNLLSRYFTGLLLQTFIIFIFYLIVLLIFNIENALVIALISALLNIIPYIGPLISTTITAVFVLLNGITGNFEKTVHTTLYVLICYTIIQVIDNNVSSTIIASKSVKSHPLEVFIVTIIGGLLMGIIGMIIAVPLITVIKVILKEFYPNNNFIQIYTKGV